MLTLELEKKLLSDTTDRGINNLLKSLVPFINSVSKSLVSDQDLQKDLMQVALEESWNRLKHYKNDGQARIITFLRQRIRWSMIKYLRDTKEEKVKCNVEYDESMGVAGNNVERIIFKQQKLEMFLEQFNQLSDVEREFLTAKFFGTKTYDELALKHSTTVFAINNIVMRAKAKLGLRGVS